MTTEERKPASKKEKSRAKVPEGPLFQCPFCGQSKPLGQMLLITRFFPPLVACRDCEARVS